MITRKAGNDFEIVVGQRRFLAGKEIGLKDFPCIVKELSDQEALEYSLIENLQRKDVDPLDIAKALKKLYDMSQFHGEIKEWVEQEGKKIGLSYVEVWRYLSLLNLTPEVQEMVSEDKLGIKLASQLATVEKEALEYSLIENLQRKDVGDIDVAKALKKDFEMLKSVQRLDSSKKTHKEIWCVTVTQNYLYDNDMEGHGVPLQTRLWNIL